MKRIAISLAALIAAVDLAHAADSPSTKSVVEKTDCYASVQAWWNASPKDCPLTYGPLTLFGNIDMGGGWNEAGIQFGGRYDKGVFYGIKSLSRGSRWGLANNALGNSGIGVKLKQKLTDDWDLIGLADTGFNPYSGMFANGPKSLADQNRTAKVNTQANDDSSRAGQWANGQAYVGLSNKTFGDFTFGRQNALNADVISAYDPVKSGAFSQINFSGSYGGFGNTEISKINTAVEYKGKYSFDKDQTIRFAGQAQVGNGYYFGNASMGQYGGQVGVDWNNFSFDVVGSYAKDAVALSSYYNSGIPAAYANRANDILKATLSNNLGWTFAGKYKWEAFTFYAGYSFYRQMSPSDAYAQGFDTIAEGIFVPAGQVTINKYLTNRVLNTYWIGGKWDTPVKDLAFNTGVYYSTQPNYATSWSSCNGKNNNTSNGACPGTQTSYSFLFTYKLLKRVDLYAGVMVSNVTGGLSSGYYYTQSIDPTAGLRVNF